MLLLRKKIDVSLPEISLQNYLVFTDFIHNIVKSLLIHYAKSDSYY